jgi:hypothetical protein
MQRRPKQILAAGLAAAVFEADSVDELSRNVTQIARELQVLHRQLAPLAVQFRIAAVAESAAKEELSL